RNLRGQRLPLHVDAVSGIGDAVGVPPARRCSESREYGVLQLTEEERVRVRDAHAIHSVELVKRLDAGVRPQLLRCPIGSVGPTGDSGAGAQRIWPPSTPKGGLVGIPTRLPPFTPKTRHSIFTGLLIPLW